MSTRYLAIYDNTKTYLFCNQKQATPEVVALEYTVVNMGMTCAFETDATGLMLKSAPQPLSVLAGKYEIDTTDKTDEEVLAEIQDAVNTETTEATSTEASAEERIAAALEYQNLLTTIATSSTETTTE